MGKILVNAEALTLLLVLVFATDRSIAQSSCENATRSGDTGGSCSFESGQCRWSNLDGDELNWEREDNSFGRNSYIKVDMSGVAARSTGFLSSPMLCATGSDVHTLTFRYAIHYHRRCRLSVFVVTGANATEVWSTTRGTGNSFSPTIDPIYLRCSGHQFQIVLTGEKLSSRACGSYYNEIDVDDIVYSNIGLSSSEGHECPPLPAPITTTKPTTIVPPVTVTTKLTVTTVSHLDDTADSGNSSRTPPLSTLDKRRNSQTGDEGGANSGVVAGVVVAVVVILVAAIAGVIFIRRKRAGRTKQSNLTSGMLKPSRSMTNNTYMLDACPTIPSALPDVTVQSQQTDDHINVYETAESPNASSVYSVPDDLQLHPTATLCKGHHSGGHELSTLPQPLSGSQKAEGPALKSAKQRQFDGASGQSNGRFSAHGSSNYELAVGGAQSESAKSNEVDNYDQVDLNDKAKDKNKTTNVGYSLAQNVKGATTEAEHNPAMITKNSDYINMEPTGGDADADLTENYYSTLDFDDDIDQRLGAADDTVYYNTSGKDAHYYDMEQGGGSCEVKREAVYYNIGTGNGKSEI